MSGGSAFYVLIYAIFYFVNKVLSFLSSRAAPFWGSWLDLDREAVGLPVCPGASGRQLSSQRWLSVPEALCTLPVWRRVPKPCLGGDLPSAGRNPPAPRVPCLAEGAGCCGETALGSVPELLCSASAGHRGVHPLPAVLRLHHPHGPVLLAPHRHHWLLRRLHVCPQDLRRSENRLRMRRGSSQPTPPRVRPAGSQGDDCSSSSTETTSSGSVTREINNSSFWNVTLAQCTWTWATSGGKRGL